MRLNLTLIVSIILAVGLVSIAFTFYQISSDRNKLESELQVRVAQISEEVLDAGWHLLEQMNSSDMERFSDSLSSKYNLLGIARYFNEDSISGNIRSHDLITHSQDDIAQAIAADTFISNFMHIAGENIYQYILPITPEHIPKGAIVFYADANYIDNIIESIWFRNFLRWFLQALLVSAVSILVLQRKIFHPLNRIVDWTKALRAGNTEASELPHTKFLGPLQEEIIHISKAMQDAKATAEEEARLRTTAEVAWTPERLKIEMENLLQGKRLIVVSNREPYMHIRDGKEIRCIVPASGMITAIEPILESCGGLWIASGTGDADKETVDAHDKLQVPPHNPKYTLRRLWQTKEEEDHFYYGFSNEGLWPLCHIAHTRPIFRIEDWNYYQKVNAHFAEAILEETAGEEQPFILIQDYHFALLPELLRKAKPKARIAIFWHIPWPNPESFNICPWQKEILSGMLGADLIGFHTQYHCNHFLETVSNALESRVTWDNFSVERKGHSTFVKPFPISIAFTLKDYYNSTPRKTVTQLLGEHGINAEFMGIGVDRIDYTKGIVEKFLAVERFLEKNPSYIGKFTFVQIGAPSRTLLKSYSDITNTIESEANRINWRFKSKNWKAILFLKKHHSHEEILPFYHSANFCMVTSLHDGMNLVAKEFVASRNHNDGSLILSRFTGAAQELKGALFINPYDIEQTSDAISQAIDMSKEEQFYRMNRMRQVIVEQNIYSWASALLKAMAAIKN